MYALLLTWDLRGLPRSTIEDTLRRYVADGSRQRYRDRRHLRRKVWFSDVDTMSWGAFYLWDTEEAREEEVATMHRVEDLVGVAPTVVRWTVEAVQDGDHSGVAVDELGLAAGYGSTV